MTVVTTQDLGGADAAARWLDRAGGDPEAAGAFVERAVRLVNEALHAHATAAQDPYVGAVSAEGALTTRLGYGEGEQVADGRWSDARELLAAEPRRRRTEALAPAERVAAVLGGRERVEPSEALLMRARLDLDQGRLREAALQLEAGIVALIAEPATSSPAAAEDVNELRARRDELGAVAEAARRQPLELDPDRAAWLSETLARAERTLRRRRAAGVSNPQP